MADNKTQQEDLSQFRQVHKVPVKKERKKLSGKTIAMIVVIIILIVAIIAGGLIYKNNEDAYTVKVSNNKNVITGDFNVSKQGYFENLLKTQGASKIVDDAYNGIVNKLIPDKKYQSQINKAVKSKEKTYSSYMGSLKSYATNMGYSSVKEFEKDSVIPDAKSDLLKKKYFNDNYQASIKKYHPVYIKTISVSKESQGITLIKKAKSEKAFNKLMKNKKYKANANDYGFVTTKTPTTTLNKAVKDQLSKFAAQKKDGVYPTSIRQSSNRFVVVYVYHADHNANKARYVKELTNLPDTTTDVKVYYLKKYKFTVYDKKLKKAIKKLNKNYITD